MKMIVQILTAALLVSSTDIASAKHVPSHAKHSARDYTAFSPNTHRPVSGNDRFGPVEDSDTPNSTATGGPAGGLGS